MALILLLDTATTVCSAALAEDGRILTHVSVNEGYRHAENVISLCRKVLSDAQKTTGQLDALAVSAGPGSYTGLRIGVSAAKGLCYGLDIPLIAVSTLQMMAANFYDDNPDFKGLAVPMIDARRMEVYTGIYNYQGECLLRDHALVMNESSLRLIEGEHSYGFFGDGAAKCREIVENTLENAYFDTSCQPDAQGLRMFAEQAFMHRAFADLAYVEPEYLKPYQGTPPKKQ